MIAIITLAEEHFISQFEKWMKKRNASLKWTESEKIIQQTRLAKFLRISINSFL